MDHLQSGHKGLGQFTASAVHVTDAGDEKGTKPFTAGHGAVAHGIRDGGCGSLSCGHAAGIGQVAEQDLLAFLHQLLHDFRISFVLFQNSSSLLHTIVIGI